MNTFRKRNFNQCGAIAALIFSTFLLSALNGAAQAAPSAANAAAASPSLRALLVGGGPDKPHNQFAIESNVRYVKRLLPAATPARILFANGTRGVANVQYLDKAGHRRYRTTQIPVIDGPSRLSSFQKALADLSAPGGPLLLYFTGHGSPDNNGEFANNAYNMWGNDDLTVKRLAGYLDTISPDTPVTLVMVQCFSGAFGNLLFQGGDPNGAWANRNFCGFFASVPTREAAGCTPEVNEADYHDFTSYFFAALTGEDRMGKKVSGADYDHNGTVGMNEAFDYTLIHDISIDTPVCTSDVFLRRYVPVPDPDVFETKYADIHAWASPSQRAVLDELSAHLHLIGEGRLKTAYGVFKQRAVREGSDEEEERTALWIRFVRCAKSVYLAHQLENSADQTLKQHYAALLAAESANPLAISRPADKARP